MQRRGWQASCCKMAVELETLRSLVGAAEHNTFDKVTMVLRSSLIAKVIDLALLDDEDVDLLLGSDEPMKQLGLKPRAHALGFMDGWAQLTSLEFRHPCPSPTMPVTCHVAASRTERGGAKTSAVALRAATSSFTKQVLFGATAKAGALTDTGGVLVGTPR